MKRYSHRRLDPCQLCARCSKERSADNSGPGSALVQGTWRLRLTTRHGRGQAGPQACAPAHFQGQGLGGRSRRFRVWECLGAGHLATALDHKSWQGTGWAAGTRACTILGAGAWWAQQGAPCAWGAPLSGPRHPPLRLSAPHHPAAMPAHSASHGRRTRPQRLPLRIGAPEMPLSSSVSAPRRPAEPCQRCQHPGPIQSRP